MDRQALERYAPIALVVIAIIFQWNLFVTPAEIEKLHREILQEVAQTHVSKSELGSMKDQLNDMNKKIDKIYDKFISGK